VPDEPAPKAFRICIDVNVWVAYLMAIQNGRTGTSAQAVIAVAREMKFGERPVQLIISLEMADTLERVLTRVGFSAARSHDFASSVIDLMKAGPEQLDPHLLISGRDQLGMHDREDAGVLATAIAAKADLIVTDNLRDFQTNDGETIKTRMVRSGVVRRRLFSVIVERADGVSIVVAHPIDVVDWLRNGREISAVMVRQQYRK
jgi:predicted nucleic acid-binding protein